MNSTDSHVSECESDSIQADIVVQNNSTVEKLQKKIARILEQSSLPSRALNNTCVEQ